MKEMERLHGAALERGRVVKIENGKYRVESLDRPGLKSTAMKVFSGETLTEGDSVFFTCLRTGTESSCANGKEG